MAKSLSHQRRMRKDKKMAYTKYRPRKKVIEDLHEKGEINDIEDEQLKNAVTVADKAKVRGKYFLD